MKPDHELARDAGWHVYKVKQETWTWIDPDGTVHTEVGDWASTPTLPKSAESAIEALRVKATPDLIEAARLVVDSASFNPDGGIVISDKAYNAIEAAIFKAEGDAQK